MASFLRRIKGDQSAVPAIDLADSTPQSISSTSLPSHPRQQPAKGRKDDPLGLSVLYEPPERTLDIVFIHGLGGTSKRTWCHNRDLEYLWPQLWLPQELPAARILTFGYNADFSSRKEKSVSNITDFARDLLYSMKYGENTRQRLGQVPIVVIAHSMGGLVFKKAFIHGHTNDEFHSIVSMIKAVLFLATPHHGTDLAKTLNKVLSASFFGHSPKEYVAELDERSKTINELNQNFRQHALGLKIFSFYETLETELKVRPIMIVEKSSAVIGYPDEMIKPLDANHHTVCKFRSQDDPNYASVLGALRDIYGSLEPPGSSEMRLVSDLLGILGPPEEEIVQRRSERAEGTCGGFLNSKEVEDWLRPGPTQVLWVHSPPGSGKSTTCSFLIEHLLQKGHSCSYFFFRHKQLGKHSSSDMLKSIAYQLAFRIPDFRRALVELFDSGVRLFDDNAAFLWKRLFFNILAKIPTDKHLYWVIDALDECDSAREAFQCLLGLNSFQTRVHVIIFSRDIPDIQQAFHQAGGKLPVVDISLPDNTDDIRLVVARDMDSFNSSKDFKEQTIADIAARSQTSFLWARLVTKQMVTCHRRDQVTALLTSTPDGMSRLYDRMMDDILSREEPKENALAKILLAWAMYAKTPVTVDELSELYPTALGGIIDLSHTITQLCGQFVVVDTRGRLVLLHHSAREYLRQSTHQNYVMDSESANEEIAKRCLDTLCDKNLRQKIKTLKIPKFLSYASTLWPVHLEDCLGRCRDIARFLSGVHPLPWIYYLAMSGRLAQLYEASRALHSHAVALRKDYDQKQYASEIMLAEVWATDMMRIAAKFGRHLSESPGAIYKYIPAFCPKSSIIHQKFNDSPAMTLDVSGLNLEEWDDCQARVSCGTGRTLRLAASTSTFAVVSDVPRGTITIWETTLFHEIKTLAMEEHIWAIAYNRSGALFACYSATKTIVWKTADWSVVLSVDNPRQERAIELSFDETDALMTVSEQSRVYRLPSASGPEAPRQWEQLDEDLLQEPNVPAGTWLSTPSCVAFSYDCTQMAVAYNSFPLTIWTVDPPEITARLRKRPGKAQNLSLPYTGDTKLAWHPSGEIVFGIRGRVFKWSTIDNSYQELEGHGDSNPYGIQCSPSGRLFATTYVAGVIRIYDTSSMALVYHLSSVDPVIQMCFSPDSARLYDIRSDYCDVWEPECLLRLGDAAVRDQINEESTAVNPNSRALEQITQPKRSTGVKAAMAAIRVGSTTEELVAYVTGDGPITLYDPENNKTYQTGLSMLGFMLYSISWSPKHQVLARSKANGAPTVASVLADKHTSQVVFTTLYDESSTLYNRGQTRGLLLDATGTRLLVSGTNAVQILSLPHGKVLGEEKPKGRSHFQWHQYPSSSDHFLHCKFLSLDVFAWADFEHKATISINLAEDYLEGSSLTQIDAFLDNHCPHLVLLRISSTYPGTRYSFAVLETKHIRDPASIPPNHTVDPLPLPESLTSLVSHAIGILPDGRLVFVEKQMWVCTTATSLLSSAFTSPFQQPRRHGSDIKICRHFFLPQDWITPQTLLQCHVLRDGTFLCPVKGKVAVMRGDLITE